MSMTEQAQIHQIQHQVKDRFEAAENPCDSCRWLDEAGDTDFPCSHCIHNMNHV